MASNTPNKRKAKPRSAATRAKQSAAAKANIPDTELRIRFVENYLGEAKMNGTEAVMMLDPTRNRASAAVLATRWLKREDVIEMIAAARQKLADKFEITSERIMRELALLGFANMQDYGSVTESGLFRLDLSKADRDNFAAISEITSRQISNGENAPPIIETKLKLSDKKGALSDLAKIMGLYKETPDVNLNVSFVVERTERSRNK